MPTAPNEDLTEAIQPYSMHVRRLTVQVPNHVDLHQVSARYLDLTKRKLELSRLPRENPPPSHHLWCHGTPKSVLEPLLDFWLEQYDWRAQEQSLNNRLPQYRTAINLPNGNADTTAKTTYRIHFVHKRCRNRRAIPLLFCHGWPGSFLEVCKIIDPLTSPDFSALPPGARVPLGFHVVAPSIPGFGFSDASHSDNFGLKETAQIFDALMKQLGYEEYVAHGSEWGFPICRMLSLYHTQSCLAVHTISPNLPPPNARHSPAAAIQFFLARLTSGRLPQLSFGYLPSDLLNCFRPAESSKALSTTLSLRPQTHAYSLCDSPLGLLSIVLDILRPSHLVMPPKPTGITVTVTEVARQRSNNPFMESIPESVVSVPPPPEWVPEDVLNYTMMQWLPGPEAGLRWLAQVRKESSIGEEGLLWRTWSGTPLCISTFRSPYFAPEGKDLEDGEQEPVETERKPSTVHGFGEGNMDVGKTGLFKQAQKLLNLLPWRHSTRHRRVSTTEPNQQDIEDHGVPPNPPVWAAAHQKLAWVCRHEKISRMPVWEVPEQVALDIRDCFGDLVEERSIVFRALE